MAMALICTGCGQSLSVPETSAGRLISCPYCGTVMDPPQAPPPASQQQELLEPEVLPESASSPFGGSAGAPGGAPNVPQRALEDAGDRRPCPMCGELINTAALKCRFCGEIFDPELKKAQKASQGDTAGPDDDLSASEWIFSILCGSIACIVGIVWLIQGKKKGGKMILVALVSQAILGLIQALAAAGRH